MAIERIIIDVSGDPSSLKSTIDALQKVGKVDKENRESFEKTGTTHKRHLKEESELTESLKEQFKELGTKIVAAFAVEKIIEFGEECIKQFEEAEKSANRLKFAVENINGGGATAFKELTEESERLSKSVDTLFTPAQIQKAQAQLAQAKVSTEQIIKVMPLILDVSAKTGDSLETVTSKFVMATEAGGRGLKEYGGKFTDLGDRVKNLDRAMEELQGFAGGATDALNTAAGQAQQTKAKMEELEESIGGKLAPSWENLKTATLEWIDVILSGSFEEAYNKIGDMPKKAFAAQAAREDAAALAAAKQNLKDLSETLKEATDKELEQFKKEAEDKYAKELYHDPNGKEYTGKEETQDQIDLYNITQKTNELRVQMARDEIAARKNKKEQAEEDKKEAAEEAERIKGLSKLTDKEINDRITALKNGNYALYAEYKNFNDKGAMTEEQRLQKELDQRKQANEKLLALQRNFEETLRALRDAIDVEESKASIDLIKDKYEKETAQENENFRQRQVAITEQRRKLNEIIEKGNEQQAAQAKELLAKTDRELELDEQDHQDRLRKIVLQANEDMLAIELDTKRKISAERIAEDDELNRKELIELKRQLKLRQITQQEYDEEVKRRAVSQAQTKQRITLEEDQAEIDSLNKKLQAQQAAGDTPQAIEATQREIADAKRRYANDQIKTANDVAQAEVDALDSVADAAEKQKKVLEAIFDSLQHIFDALTESIESNISAIDTQMQRQTQMVEYQKTLAEQGLANDLAFEERRADELAAKKLEEQRKIKREKELETFLNSVAKFAEDNPKTAVAKALGVLASTKIAEAIFAEEGALVGETGNTRYRPGMSHRSGRNVHVIAEPGERILSVQQTKAFDAIGGLSLLKKPFTTMDIPVYADRTGMGSNDVLQELRELKEITKNKAETNFEFVRDITGRLELLETRFENGITTKTRHSRFDN